MTLLAPIGVRPDLHRAVIIDGVADGYEAFALARLSAEAAAKRPLVFVARDGARIPQLAQALAYAAPGVPVSLVG